MPAQSIFKIKSMIYVVNCLDFCLVLVFVYAESAVAYGMWCQVFPIAPHTIFL